MKERAVGQSRTKTPWSAGVRGVDRALAVSGALLLGAGLGLTSCSLEIPEVDEDAFNEFEENANAEIQAILRVLFPALSDDEIAELSVSISYEDVVALRAELEEVRMAAAEFSADLFKTAEERAEERAQDLADANDGFPETLEPVGRICTYDASSQTARLQLSGVFSGQTPVQLAPGQVSVTVGGTEVDGTLTCLASDETVDIVFLVDITGSMSNVIASVRDSVASFISAIDESGVRGTVSVVSFQDTVGVNVTFQEPSPSVERSPFFEPVPLGNAAAVEEIRSFVNRLEANSGADAPENLSGAIDFARNNVIGGTEQNPNVIDGSDDPRQTSPFPALTSDRQVFVALTDSTFHNDSRTSSNSSLEPDFVPRNAQTILETLHRTGTTVHVVDPSWVDMGLNPADADARQVDSDYWAINTGGLGEDVVLGYSLVDLELVVVSERTGLLDVVLDGIVATSCTYEFQADLSAEAEVELSVEAGGELFTGVAVVAPY